MSVNDSFTDEDLLAYLEERLPVADSHRMEETLRNNEPVRQRLAHLIEQQDQGEHSVGEIWRRSRASCPARTVWAAWLAGRLGDAMAQYLKFHLEQIGCRHCQANVDDLQSAESHEISEGRTRKFFETSIGRLVPRH